MSVSVSSILGSTISVPVVTTASTQKPGLDAQAATGSTTASDSVTLTQRALDFLRDAGETVKEPGVDSSKEDIKEYQLTLATAALGIKKAESIQLNPVFQSYADTINDPKASDEQKLEAYKNYTVDSTLADNAPVTGYHYSNQDYKFDVLTRGSDFMKAVNSMDFSSYTAKQAAARAQGLGGSAFEEYTGTRIDAGLSSTSLQQSAYAIRIFSWHLMFAIDNEKSVSPSDGPKALNAEGTPGYFLPNGKPANTKNAVAEAVADSFRELSDSRAGSSSSPVDVAYTRLFTKQFQSFADRALSRPEMHSDPSSWTP